MNIKEHWKRNTKVSPEVFLITYLIGILVMLALLPNSCSAVNISPFMVDDGTIYNTKPDDSIVCIRTSGGGKGWITVIDDSLCFSHDSSTWSKVGSGSGSGSDTSIYGYNIEYWLVDS